MHLRILSLSLLATGILSVAPPASAHERDLRPTVELARQLFSENALDESRYDRAVRLSGATTMICDLEESFVALERVMELEREATLDKAIADGRLMAVDRDLADAVLAELEWARMVSYTHGVQRGMGGPASSGLPSGLCDMVKEAAGELSGSEQPPAGL